jgi:hypothetical protein
VRHRHRHHILPRHYHPPSPQTPAEGLGLIPYDTNITPFLASTNCTPVVSEATDSVDYETYDSGESGPEQRFLNGQHSLPVCWDYTWSKKPWVAESFTGSQSACLHMMPSQESLSPPAPTSSLALAAFPFPHSMLHKALCLCRTCRIPSIRIPDLRNKTLYVPLSAGRTVVEHRPEKLSLRSHEVSIARTCGSEQVAHLDNTIRKVPPRPSRPKCQQRDSFHMTLARTRTRSV